MSHSTVSRALQNSSLVSRKTAERIQRIASESGFKLSAVARGLATRKTRTIGVVVTTIADPFAGEVLSGIEESANHHGYSVVLAESNADPEREKKMVHSLAERRVDGIIVTSSRVGALYVPLLSEMMVPIVLINNQHPGEFVHTVLIDNIEGSRMAATHLIALGHKRIAYLGDRFGHQSDSERLAGYREALARAGIAFVPDLVVHGNGKPDGAASAMEKLFELSNRPTAVVCYNDMSALGTLRYLRSLGLYVPADVSVVGFDDLPIAPYLDPPLTTVKQPMRRMGSMALEGLLKIITGEGSAGTMRIPAELVVRESTGPIVNNGEGKGEW